MMTFRRWTRALLAAAAVGGALPAAAIPLPAAFVLGEMSFNLETTRTSLAGFGALDHSLATHGTLGFQASGEPLPAMSVTANLTPAGTGSGRADGLLRYSFEIVSATDTLVPVFANATGHVAGLAEAGAAFAAFSRWSLRNTSEITLVGDILEASTSAGGPGTKDFAESHLVMLQTNTEYRVVMEVMATGGTVDVGRHAEAEAFIDPWFGFGEGVDTSLFSFHFTEGIGNTPPEVEALPVPEPGTPATVLLALGVMALVRRRAHGPAVRA